jgi:peptidyl-prolyl cis-trans isomerase A (cyclophilin A)
MRYRAPRSAAVHPDFFLSLESRTLLDGSPLPTLAMLESPTNAVVRMETTYGDIDIELFNTDAPLTTAGFLERLRHGDYTQTFFHNLVAGTTLSGGLYSFDDASGLQLREEPFEVDANFARSNIERTIAVPFIAGTPNTTPGGFVFNLADNSATANGNFVVFGRVIQGWDVITNIADLDTADLSGFFPGKPSAANLTSVPVTQANPTAMSEDLIVPLTDIQIIKPAGNTGFYSSRLYMPEGYSWERIFESVELMNPGSQASDYQILVRYANDTDNRDQVIATGTLDADRRATVVVAPGFGQPSTVVRNNEPYAYEVWSTSPIVAGFRHKDFKSGTGETFFRPESLSDPMAMRDWTFT